MSLSKGKIINRTLALILAIAVPAGTVYAERTREPKEDIITADVPESPAGEDTAKASFGEGNAAEFSFEGGEPEKQARFIEVEEEVTKMCGEIFSLDVKLKEQPDAEEEDKADEAGNREDAGAEEESVRSEAGAEEESVKSEAGAEEESVKSEAGAEEESAKKQAGTGEEPVKDEASAEEFSDGPEPEDVLQYESSDTEIAVIEEDEAGKVRIKAVGAGDTVIKITAPETEVYEKAEAQVLLHVTASEPEEPVESSGDEEAAGLPEPESLADTPKEVTAMSLLSASNLKVIENVADGIRLQWGKVEGAYGYYVERSQNGRSPWSRVKTAANADDVTFIDTQVEEGKTYYYRVRAFDAEGKEGLTGASKKMIRIIAPTLNAGVSPTGTELSWNRVTGCSGYYVYRRKPSQKDWTVVSTITQPGEITWRDTAAGNGTAYIYSVRAYKGSSLSPYAGEKSYVRVAAPSVKSFKRKSSTKFRLVWKANTSASGYQIQYAQNGMFAGAKKVTVKNAKTSGYTLSKLAKKKDYYARIRAYKKVEGKTYYSAWSAASNVKKTRTTKATLLSKKKKAFEIRTWAKQKMYQYDTLQGSCTDGTYAYYLLNNRKAANCKLVKVKRSSLKVVKVSGVLDVAHGNDMTYDSNRKRLVIVHSTGVDPKRLTSVDPQTLKVIESKHVQIPKKLAGGSTEDAKGATAFSGVAYSKGRKQYAVLLSHNYNFVMLDSNLDPIRYVKVSKKNNYIVQGIDATDDYIMLAQSPKTSKQKYNIITVYDWDGKYISKINVKKGYEIESIYHVGSKYYAGFYCSHYKTYYKNVDKKVTVNGKEVKKRVKVKYRKLQRDNYVYQIKGI